MKRELEEERIVPEATDVRVSDWLKERFIASHRKPNQKLSQAVWAVLSCFGSACMREKRRKDNAQRYVEKEGNRDMGEKDVLLVERQREREHKHTERRSMLSQV